MTERIVEKKLKFFQVMILLIFIIIVSRLVLLQLVQTQEFKTLSEQNRIRLVPIAAKRGEILDQSRKVLVKDRPVYSVTIAYLGLKDQDTEEVADKLGLILGMDSKDIIGAIDDPKVRKFEPIKIASDVSMAVVTKIEENRAELPGVNVTVEPMRQYVNGDFMPHILGYVREITPDQLDKNKDEAYSLGDRFGQAGLENVYEKYLRGKDGDRQVEVDKSQHPVRYLDIKQPIPGNNMILNIDYKTQKAAEDALIKTMADLQVNGYPDARAGAAVLLDVNTGKVLAMASKPGYDPNIFNGRITPEQSATLFGGKAENPFPAFNNRAIMGYAPGSTFKMVTATAVLETKAAAVDDTIFDSGGVYLAGRRYRCWKTSGHGTVNLIKAIQVSCNTYFYQMGLRAGVDALYKYASEYGLGQKTGIDLPGESAGRAPSPQWKKELNEEPLKKKFDKIYAEIRSEYEPLIKKATTDKEQKELTRAMNRELNQQEAEYKIQYNWNVNWQDFETIIMSIGQGYNFYTPLQMANYIATIANGGTRYKPYLVDKIVDYQGNVVKQFDKQVSGRVDVSPETLAAIKQGMRAVTEPGGTAAGVYANFPVEVSAKTGTAQTGKDKDGNDRPNHGWFVAFAPADNPQVAVASIIEYGGHGGSTAGVVARDIMAAYFDLDKSKLPQGGTSDE